MFMMLTTFVSLQGGADQRCRECYDLRLVTAPARVCASGASGTKVQVQMVVSGVGVGVGEVR